jgi:hypothetical protein
MGSVARRIRNSRSLAYCGRQFVDTFAGGTKLLVRATEPFADLAGRLAELGGNRIEPSVRFRRRIRNYFLEGDLIFGQDLNDLFPTI